MVNAGIFSTSFMEMKTDTDSFASGKSSQPRDDFNKILSEHSNDFRTSKKQEYAPVKETDTVNVKKEEFKKLFTKKGVSNADELPAQEAVSCIAVQTDEFYKQIVNELSEKFNMSAEQIEECMNDLGLDFSDLFDKQNVIKLVMELAGTNNMSDVLVNNTLSETVKNVCMEFQSFKENLMKELPMTQEEFESLLKKVDAAIEEMKESINNTNAEFVVSETDEEFLVQRNDMAENDAVAAENVNGQNGSENVKLTEEATGNNTGENSSDTGAQEEKNKDLSMTENSLLGSVVEGLKNAVDESLAVRESGITQRIISKVIDEIRMNITPNATSIELQLEPESLGKVSIAVTAKAGVLTAHIAAENEVAKEAIESQMNTLKEAFESQGLKVDEVEVTLASRSFEQDFGKEQNSGKDNQTKTKKHISQKELDEINGISQPAELSEEIHKDMGNTVSYTA